MIAPFIRHVRFLTTSGVIAALTVLAVRSGASTFSALQGSRISGMVAGTQPAARSSPGGQQLAPAPVVEFYRGLECGLGAPDYTASIAPDGAYELRHLPEGVYSACLPHAPNSAGHFGPLDFLVAGEDVRVDLDFKEGPRSTGSARAMAFRAQPGMKGVATLSGLEAGKSVQGRVVRAVPDGPANREAVALPGGGPLRPVPGLASTAVVYLVPVEAAGVPARTLAAVPTSMELPSDGEFTIDNVPPGRYNLFATVPDSESKLRGETGSVSVGRTTISIEGFELATLSITVHRGVPLAGRVVRNGRPFSSGVVLALEPDMDVAGILAYQDVARFRPAVADDGSFAFHQVPEGRYRLRVSVSGQPGNGVRVLQNGKDLKDASLDVGVKAPAPIEVVIEN